MNQSIIEKIKKLNTLSRRASTEAEAVNAATRMAEICLKHNLELGAVLIEEQETKATEAMDEPRKGRYKRWWTSLSKACENLFDVGSLVRQSYRESEGVSRKTRFDQRQSIVFFGLKANTEAALMTYQYLVASVQAMLKGYIAREGPIGTAEQNQFCLGCAYGIFQKSEAAAKQRSSMIEGSAECMAIVRLGNELIANYKAQRRPEKSAKPRKMEVDADFIAGYKASQSVDLHGAKTSRMLES